MTYQQTPKRDFRQELTDNIIAALEKGVPPWRQGWQSGAVEMPRNPVSGKPYRGGNVVSLMCVAAAKGYGDPRWMTYRQANESGWQVRRGERGAQVEFWKPVGADDEKIDISDENDGRYDRCDRTRFIHRTYTVFNASQIDGIPEREPKIRNGWETVQSGESILRNSGAKIVHSDQDRAFYRKSTDSIHLPPKTAFLDATGYYGTALHELAHWSGHPDRLNRDTLAEPSCFGDPTYAREELRAELASVFIMAEKGIPYRMDNNAAYVGSWLKALREDKNEIFRAARDAHKAADFIAAFDLKKSLDQTVAGDGGVTVPMERPVAEPVGEAARSPFAARVRQPATKPVEMEM